MVEKENITLPIEIARSLIASARLERAAAGGWTLVIEFDGDCAIDDARSVSVRREVRIGGLTQSGRKPLPPHVNEALQAGRRKQT